LSVVAASRDFCLQDVHVGGQRSCIVRDRIHALHLQPLGLVLVEVLQKRSEPNYMRELCWIDRLLGAFATASNIGLARNAWGWPRHGEWTRHLLAMPGGDPGMVSGQGGGLKATEPSRCHRKCSRRFPNSPLLELNTTPRAREGAHTESARKHFAVGRHARGLWRSCTLGLLRCRRCARRLTLEEHLLVLLSADIHAADVLTAEANDDAVGAWHRTPHCALVSQVQFSRADHSSS